MDAKRASTIANNAQHKIRKHNDRIAAPILRNILQTVKGAATQGRYECTYTPNNTSKEILESIRVSLGVLGYSIGGGANNGRI